MSTAPLKHGSARPRDNSAAKEFHTNTEFPLTSQQRSFNNAMSAAPPRGGSKRKQAKENMPARMFTEEEDAEMASEILSPRPPPDDIAPSDLALFVAGGSKSAKSSKRPSIASTQVMMENTEVLFTKKDKAPSSNADVKWKRLFCCAGPLNKEKQNDRQQAGEEVDPNEVIAVKVEEENLLRTVKKHHSQIGRSLLPGYDSRQGTKKCFLIDLDETLVHSSFVPSQKYDFKLNIEIEGKFHQIFVLKRPFVDVFLDTIGPLFECVLFTASLSKYADPVTDFIDPKRFFQHRLFREHCVFFHGNYVKDLSLLGRDVDQCVILDNSPVSYLFHHTHAVHIISWFDNMNDTALLDLIPFFERLSQAPDVPNFLSNNAPPVSASGSNVFSSESGSGATLQRPLSYLHALRSKSRRDSNIITQTKPEQ